MNSVCFPMLSLYRSLIVLNTVAMFSFVVSDSEVPTHSVVVVIRNFAVCVQMVNVEDTVSFSTSLAARSIFILSQNFTNHVIPTGIPLIYMIPLSTFARIFTFGVTPVSVIVSD